MKDNYDYFLENESRLERWLERRPKCDRCGERIQSDYLFRFDGELYCPDCFKEYCEDNFREYID